MRLTTWRRSLPLSSWSPNWRWFTTAIFTGTTVQNAESACVGWDTFI